MTPTISSLLSRVRAARGPDRELDARIDAALFGGRAARDFTGDDPAPCYTASIDDAVALVERALPGWRFRSMEEAGAVRLEGATNGDWLVVLWECRRAGGGTRKQVGKTLPLAILAALLSALEQKESAG